MKSRFEILHATRLAGRSVLFLGIAIFLYGYMEASIPIIGIGIGTVAGAIIIFLMGMFFIATEEMVENTDKGIEIKPLEPGKVIYLKHFQ